MPFQNEVDIANRAAQHLGVPHIINLYPADESVTAHEITNAYDKIRDAELQRNLWVFATRTTAIRALDTTSSIVNFEAWNSSTTYPAGYIVTYNNLTWVSLNNSNLNNIPGVAVAQGQRSWDVYFGNTVANMWNDSILNTSTTNNIRYHAGELVYYLSTGNIYVSIVEGNTNDPTVVDTWSSQTMYSTGEVVSFNNVNYQSLVNRNFGFEPDISGAKWTSTVTNPTVSRSWKQLTGASLSTLSIVYPITAGPFSDTATRNAYKLPAGFLRIAPKPPVGIYPYGARSGPSQDDWTIRGGYLTTNQNFDTGDILFPFIARVTDVSTMEDMFCEGLAARIAWEVAKNVIQDPKLWADARRDALRAYEKIMGEARIMDMIQEMPVAQVECEYIQVRY